MPLLALAITVLVAVAMAFVIFAAGFLAGVVCCDASQNAGRDT